MSLISLARTFAIGAHESIGQKRKYTNEPYWHHCEEVAKLTHMLIPNASNTAIAAAWLHDVVEDTYVTIPCIAQVFGYDVAKYVDCLTSVPKDYGTRAERKAQDRHRLTVSPPEVQSIKLADISHNISSIVEHDPKFAKVYIPEKLEMLKVLDRASPAAIDYATAILSRAQTQLSTYGIK